MSAMQDVLQEFGAWDEYQNEVPEEVHWRSAEAMASEIVRLRTQLAAAPQDVLTAIKAQYSQLIPCTQRDA